MTDMTGIRIITFFDSHVQSISELIKGAFDVDRENSLDRTASLGMDRLGYRSVHFVCTLGTRRSTLPEFKELGKLKFEVQVRTVLQHAWAELAHDRAYKFPGVLPPELERKLNLYSGMLEIADAAFDEIASKIDQYKESLSSGDFDKLIDSPIDSINVKKYMDKCAKTFGVKMSGDVGATVIGELKAFGVNSIKDFSEMINENKVIIFSDEGEYYYLGTIRDAMMLKDINKYFEKSWDDSWHVCDAATLERIGKKHGKIEVEEIFDQYGIEVQTDED